MYTVDDTPISLTMLNYLNFLSNIYIDHYNFAFICFTGDEIVMFFHQLYSNKYNILHYFYEEFFDIVLNAMKNVSYSSDGRKYYVAVYHFCEMMDNLLKEGELQSKGNSMLLSAEINRRRSTSYVYCLVYKVSFHVHRLLVCSLPKVSRKEYTPMLTSRWAQL